MKKILIALFATASVFAGVSAAQAADDTIGSNDGGRLTVQATYQAGCSLNWGSKDKVIELGSFALPSQLKAQTDSFTFKCNKLADTTKGATVTLSAGELGGAKGSDIQAHRAMYNGNDTANPLYFNVFQGENAKWGDMVWGDGSANAPAYSISEQDISGAAPKYYTVIVDPNQDNSFANGSAKAGIYKQIMVATVTYTKAAQ